MSQPVPRPKPGLPTPTGELLLRMVVRQGNLMVRQTDYESYHIHRERFIYLLTIAENDTYCQERLIPAAQAIFDEESRAFREGRFAKRQVDSGG